MAINSAMGTVSELFGYLKQMYNRDTSPSLTQYAKNTILTSRTFIERDLANEEILPPLMAVMNQMFCGYVMTALGLNQYIGEGRTIHDLLKLVSTESYIDVLDIVATKFGTADLDKRIISCEASIVNVDPDAQRLISGRIVELKLNLATDKDKDGITIQKDVTVYLYVQLVPTLIEKTTASGIITLNFEPSFSQRLAQLRAGEISFWNDFILARDLVRRHAEAIRSDKTGVLGNMMAAQQNKLFQRVDMLANDKNKSHNLASSILIVDKRTLARATNEIGIRFEDFAARQDFFNKTFMLFVAAIDTMFNNVEIYFNGLEIVGNYPFNMVKINAKGKDSFSLTEVMSAFNQGAVPKF